MSTPLATADRALYAERCRVVDLEAKLAASEARVRALEEVLRRCSSAAGHYDAATGCRAVIAIVGVALAPPLEAEKKGGE